MEICIRYVIFQYVKVVKTFNWLFNFTRDIVRLGA